MGRRRYGRHPSGRRDRRVHGASTSWRGPGRRRDTVAVIRLEVPDADGRLAAVRLASDLPLGDEQRSFERRDGVWVLELEGLSLQRLEYLLDVEPADGGTATGPDPANDARAPGVFGEKSVWLAADYEPPWWLEEARAAVPGTRLELPVRSRALRAEVGVVVWSPADTDPEEGLPLLVAHDGPEYDELAQLTRYVAVLIGDSELPRCRVALLPPGERDEWYSASAAYARALSTELLPAVGAAVAVRGLPVGMGASLGGLAMLHAQRRHRGTFSGLFLQSASFFTPRFDAHERRFGRYQRVVRFTRAVVRATAHEDTVPVVLTCGAEEENVHNNRLIGAALARQGYDAVLTEGGDLHNYTAWRDAFHPHLTGLLVRAWGPRR